MLAYQLTAWQQPPELRDVPVPEPGPGQVLMKVAGAGACHSDLHLMEWPEGTMPFDLPFTLGHENTGWVAGLGAGVEGLSEGDAARLAEVTMAPENKAMRDANIREIQMEDAKRLAGKVLTAA